MKIVTDMELTFIVIWAILCESQFTKIRHLLFDREVKVMEMIIIIAYAALGYWAAGKTVYANKIRIGTWNDLFLNRLIVGCLLGVILIPIALIKKFFFHG